MNNTDMVKAILKAVPITKDSDKELLIIYWQKAGLELTDRQIAKLRQMPSPDSITRIRRDLQLKDFKTYGGSKAVAEARYEKYKDVTQNITNETPEEALGRTQGIKVLEWGT